MNGVPPPSLIAAVLKSAYHAVLNLFTCFFLKTAGCGVLHDFIPSYIADSVYPLKSLHGIRVGLTHVCSYGKSVDIVDTKTDISRCSVLYSPVAVLSVSRGIITHYIERLPWRHKDRACPGRSSTVFWVNCGTPQESRLACP
jgi:hypothetical protein